MLSIDLFLIPILGGFLFLKYCHLTRFRAIRDNGYIILFKSAVCGFSFYGIALLFWRAAVLDTSVNPKIPEWLVLVNQFLINPDLVPALFSLILAGIALLALNYALDEDEMKKRVVRQDDDALENTSHDALFSLSSGQLTALVLSFSLALNKIYDSENGFLLIDDPVQTMDEINIASFIELLRHEFSDKQLILSTHEDDVSMFIRYKFDMFGKSAKRFNVKEEYYNQTN